MITQGFCWKSYQAPSVDCVSYLVARVVLGVPDSRSLNFLALPSLPADLDTHEVINMCTMTMMRVTLHTGCILSCWLGTAVFTQNTNITLWQSDPSVCCIDFSPRTFALSTISHRLTTVVGQNCVVSLSQQKHQQQWLAGSLSASLSIKRCSV